MNLVDVLIYQMEKLSIIEKEDSQLYRYGMQNAIVIGINLLTAIVISIILHKLEIVVIFLCMFSLVRVFAGGYHTRRKIYCYLFSNLCLIIPMYGNGLYCLLEPEIQYSSFLIICLITILLSPVESLNRKYDSTEMKHFKRRTILAVVVEMSIYAGCEIFNFNNVSYAIYSALGLVVLLMLIGKINIYVNCSGN